MYSHIWMNEPVVTWPPQTEVFIGRLCADIRRKVCKLKGFMKESRFEIKGQLVF
jgi:hypothetical protein